MPKKSEKSRYTSKYGGGSISASQKITEMICEAKAKRAGRALPEKFWELDEWNKYFRQQIPAAASLLKTYSFQAIVNALKNPAASKIFSLRSKMLTPFIDAEQRKLDQAGKTTLDVSNVDPNEKPRPQVPKKKDIFEVLDG